jgi:hypothetical protein
MAGNTVFHENGVRIIMDIFKLEPRAAETITV